jgi:DNA-binding response OmpR family regulator
MERPRVLVVEDNRVFRWWMRTALQETGFSVVCAADAKEAGWLGACFPFDVLVTDWQLTGEQDGFDVLRDMRDKHPHILAVLVSAEATAELADRAWQAGFDLVLQKPLHVAEVVGSIYCLIGERGLEVGHEAA